MARVPQVHFSGEQDKRVPASIARSFLRKIGLNPEDRLVVVPGQGHFSDWSTDWPELLQAARQRLYARRDGAGFNSAPRAGRRLSSR